jgi:tetratricopeptide (TPR) repeat protein
VRRLLALGLLLASCQATPDWSLEAARGHAAADHLIDRGDRPAARATLERLVASAPGGSAETRRVLLQDTYFRLARLALDARDPAQAARDADAGLALGGTEDLFVANLLVVRGAAQEALGQNAAALATYQRALRINEALLHDTLGHP